MCKIYQIKCDISCMYVFFTNAESKFCASILRLVFKRRSNEIGLLENSG